MNKKIIGLMMLMGISGGCLGGCGQGEKVTTLTEEEVTHETTADVNQIETTQVEESKSVEESPVASQITIPEVTMQQFIIPENDGIDFVKDMKIGWNLGNTFDACTEGNQLSDEMTYETTWCGVKTTKEMIDTLKTAGFNTVRIPVSWHNHLLDEDFTISEPWMNRVQEVVDYVIANDMYAIINMHHDISKDYYYPSNEYLENSTKYMTNIWTQISERFKAYDERLIFESVNEPRLVGDTNEWWFESEKDNCKEAAACINTLNQVFVDTVRSSGETNATRYLLVPGYAASADPVLYDSFELPEDTVENKIIVSVHAYTPYNFALQSIGDSGSTDTWHADNAKDQKGITDFMDRLYDKFVANGIPVLIGEFGARDKNDNLQARVDFTTYYIAAARARGMSCCWWDNNSFIGNGENFGLLERKTNTWRYEELVEALMKYVN